MSHKPDKEIKAEVLQTRRSGFEQIDKLPDNAETLEQEVLQAQHGTPRAFARRCVNAIGEITWQEAWNAIEKYNQQWRDAGVKEYKGVHWTILGYLHIHVGDRQLTVPSDAAQKIRDGLMERIAKMQRQVELLDTYLQGHTRSDPSAMGPLKARPDDSTACDKTKPTEDSHE